jgi:hypothetical protein
MANSGARLGLFVFVDAFGWELLQRNAFMRDVLPFRCPLGTIFGYSSTCDPTILTGVLPREHGHFSFYRYAPESSPFKLAPLLSLLPASITGRGRVRHHISKWYKRHLHYTGYFQLYSMPFDLLPHFDYTEKKDLYQPGGIINGQPTIFDHLRGRGVPFFLSDWRKGERENLTAADEAVRDGKLRFAYVYLAAMDATLHQYGPESEEGRAHVRWYDAQLRRLLQTAQQHHGEVRMHVFSDHGMTAVTRSSGLMGVINGLGLKFGVDYAAVFDSTLARFWLLNDRARDLIPRTLAGVQDGHIVSDGELRHWGADFPDRQYGDLFFLLNPGVLLCPGHLGLTPLAGMHGYAPEDPDSVAMYTASHAPETPPKRLEDLYGIMRAEADAP